MSGLWYLDSLEPIERNVVILAARNRRDFAVVARVLGLNSPSQAEQIFHQVRKKLIKPTPTPGTDWKSLRGMATELGVDRGWAQRHSGQFSRLGLSGARRSLYYPTSVLEALRTARSAQTALPAVGQYLTINQIRLALGKSHAWVAKTLASLALQPEARRDVKGNIVQCYPPSVIDMLRPLADSYQPAQDWLTADGIRALTGRSRNWVAHQLHKYEGEIRGDKRGLPRIHYSPDIVSLLMSQSQLQAVLGSDDIPALSLRQKVLEILAASPSPILTQRLVGRDATEQSKARLRASLRALHRQGLVELVKPNSGKVANLWQITTSGRQVLASV